ncbi:MAG: DUF885 domain-containing protein [Hellea sp.]
MDRKYGAVVALLIIASGGLGVKSCAQKVTGRADQTISVVPLKTENDTMLAMADDHAARILRASPEWATQLGVSEDIGGEGFGERLADFSVSGNASLIALNKALRTELDVVDRAKLTGTAAVTYDVMKNAYDVAARQNEHGLGFASLLWVSQPFAVDQLFGQHILMPRFFTAQIPITNKTQLDNYLMRLSELDRVMDEVGDLIEADAAKGAIPPVFALESVIESTRGFAEGPVDAHPVVTSVTQKLEEIDTLSEAEKAAAIEQVTDLVKSEVYPAFDRYADRVSALLPRATNDAGIWRLPNGAQLYQIALDNYGATGLTADDIHNLGLKDVARIHSEMDAILVGRGYNVGSVGQRMNALSKDPKVLYPNTDEAKEGILLELEGYVDGIMKIAPDWFGAIPPQPIEVRRIPTYEEASSGGAYYTPPALDGSQPGVFWINLKDTADWPKYSLESLVYHEGVPGHHFQAAVQQDIKDMPLIRNMMWFADYGEGWALYTEALAVEMGMYENDPLGDLGRLKMELYRAARLVVDTGIHNKRWTREQAIDWMVEATGETRSSITREIDRYSVWPGQATSYKIGMIKFQRIRAKAERELGDNFNIGAFHDAVLKGGAMPMPVLEARMDDWIETQKRSAP